MSKVVDIGHKRAMLNAANRFANQSFEATYWDFMAVNAQGDYEWSRDVLEVMKKKHKDYYLGLVTYADFEYFIIGDIAEYITRSIEQQEPQSPPPHSPQSE